MKSPTPDEINRTLEQLERTRIEMVDDGPQWQSDAQKLNLPLVNRTHSGSPLLKVDDVLRWEPAHLGRK